MTDQPRRTYLYAVLPLRFCTLDIKNYLTAKYMPMAQEKPSENEDICIQRLALKESTLPQQQMLLQT